MHFFLLLIIHSIKQSDDKTETCPVNPRPKPSALGPSGDPRPAPSAL